MPIGTAVQRGQVVYIYDEKGNQTSVVSAGSLPDDGLKGYTNSTVAIRRGTLLYTFDARGRQLSVVPAG